MSADSPPPRPAHGEARVRLLIYVLLAIGVLVGCNSSLPPSEGSLDTSEWTIVEVGAKPATTPTPENLYAFGVSLHDLGAGTTDSYEFEALGGTAEVPGVISADLKAQGVLATVSTDGVVGLSRLGTPEFFKQLDLAAGGLAWSNNGRRLAVVLFRGQWFLSLRDGSLEVLNEVALDFPTEGAVAPTTFVVSWSPDDGRIAVSTNIFAELVKARTAVVNVQTQEVDYHSLANVYFVGSETVVGVEQPLFTSSSDALGSQATQKIGDVQLLQLQGGAPQVIAVVRGAEQPVASNARNSIFLTIEKVVGFFDLPPEYYQPPVRLRDSENAFSPALQNLIERGNQLILVCNELASEGRRFSGRSPAAHLPPSVESPR
jgi:hypothetical protein